MRFGRDTRGNYPYLAVFDIGATSIGVGVSHTAGGVTSLVWSARIEYSYQAYDEYTRYERTMYSTLLEVSMKLMSEGVRAVRAVRPDFSTHHMRVACVLEAPWFWGAVGSATLTKEKPFTMTADILAELEEQAYREVTAAQESKSWHGVVGESEILERERQELLLNGYVVTSPEHDHVVSAVTAVYFGLVSSAVKKQIVQILERVIPHHDIRFGTSTHVLASYYRTTVGVGSGHRLFLVEVEGRITSVASINRGVLTRVSTLPLGTNQILHAAAPEALSTEEARSTLLVAYKPRETDPSAPIPEPITAACDAWREAVLAEFTRHSNGVVPPDRVLLMVGKRWFPILAPVLSAPWQMPSIRKERALTVTPFLELIPDPVAQKQSGTPQESHDSRLRLFTHALFYSTP
jgi:hypothetical protein